MRCIRRILLAIKDPGADVVPTVTKGIQLARAFGAHLELFHALDRRLYIDMLGVNGTAVETVEDEERAQFLQRLGRIAARARLHQVDVSVAAEWDYPAYEAVVRRAADSGADLIVAACHGRWHLAPALLELADWELLRLAPMPVLLVKQARPYHRPSILAAVDPAHAYAKPAKLDAEILELGALVSQALRGKLHAVHAFTPWPLGLARMGSATRSAGAERTPRARAMREFERLLCSSDIRESHRHFLDGHPSEVVVETAARLRSAIVVMGAVSRSGLKRLFIGNTAEQVLDRLACDLLIVKPVGFASGVARGRRGARVAAVQPSC